MLRIVLFGTGMTAATVVLHGLGTILWLRLVSKRQGVVATGRGSGLITEDSSGPLTTGRAIWILCCTTVTLALLHVTEVAIWAMAYVSIPGDGKPNGLEESFYFSMVTFTSLGYGDVVISNQWRILSGIEAMAGMLVFGWSNAMLWAAFTRMLSLSERR